MGQRMVFAEMVVVWLQVQQRQLESVAELSLMVTVTVEMLVQ